MITNMVMSRLLGVTITALLTSAVTQLAYAGTEPVVSGTPVLGASKVLELIVALLVVFAAVAALAWVGKRLQHSRAKGGALHIEAAISVGPKERVVIVQADGQRLLLGVGGGSVRTLQVLTETTAQGEGQPVSSRAGSGIRPASPVFAQLRDTFIGRSDAQ